MAKKRTEAPPPTELEKFSVPGYIMPLIAEWLQLSLSSTYAFLKAGSKPSAQIITKLANEPYSFHPSIWGHTAPYRAKIVYTRWYDLQQQEDQEDQALADILS